MLFLGCDGGSTKFAYLLCDETGKIFAYRECRGLNIIDLGKERFAQLLAEQITQTFVQTEKTPADVTGAMFGITGYGESKTSVADMRYAIGAALGHGRFAAANDSVVGWCGALKGKPGIAVVSGTGSVAYGEDGRGGAERAGGWSIHYGDEGSAYWVAVRAVNAFYRQADGRMPRTRLYDAFMAYFNVEDPLHMPMEMHEMLREDIPAIAGFQREVLKLSGQGDPCANSIYADAADELSQLVAALMRRLSFPPDTPVPVSYSGGLFKAGACIVDPFVRAVEALGARAVPPAYPPIVGAAAYAARDHLSPEALEAFFAATDNNIRREYHA